MIFYNDCTFFCEAFDELWPGLFKEELAKDLHSLIIIWPMLTKQVDIISAKGIMPPASGHWLNNHASTGFPDRSRLHWSDGSGNAAGSIGYRLQSRPHYE